MQRFLLAVSLLPTAACFFLNHDYSERYHEYTFEYHDGTNVLLVKSFTECYFLRVDDALEQELKQSEDARHKLEDQVYTQITWHEGEHKAGLHVLSGELHDLRAAWECGLHAVYELTLTSSSSSSADPPTFTVPPDTTTAAPDTTTGGSAFNLIPDTTTGAPAAPDATAIR